ncbi:unnamed protein product [Echinostoma caproni]|uniref:Endo/exonuclease/phosphatase domain-containing protein n=1 Tax=Echinostoma caproni TaxID=27848 RepID=A0A183B621_9TREM|nr:unnamed protein product [Echinostoma caproni]
MGLFYDLKHCGFYVAIFDSNKLLKFKDRSAEAETIVRFIRECIDQNRYPKTFWKYLRRCHVQPTSRTLKRHALNLMDYAWKEMIETDRLSTQYSLCANQLPGGYQSPFQHYVSTGRLLSDEKEDDQLYEYLTRVNNHAEEMVITGDFNSPEKTSGPDSAAPGAARQPTHLMAGGQRPSMLDPVLTKMPYNVEQLGISAPLSWVLPQTAEFCPFYSRFGWLGPAEGLGSTLTMDNLAPVIVKASQAAGDRNMQSLIVIRDDYNCDVDRS